MSTDNRYTVRNVAQKEIYDSYMGILRISPNEDSNGKLVDDPTIFLTTLGYKGIQLSSSNGDPLPVHFVPYAFQTSNVFFNDNGNGIRETKDIINICTDTTEMNGASGNTYVSKEFIARSSLHLIDSDETTKKYSKIAIAYGCTKTDTNDDQKAESKGILLYPFESPNDSTYFNNKNGLGLFNENDTRPRTEQVEEALLNKTLQWYNTTTNDLTYISSDANVNTTGVDKSVQSHRVKANNQYINQFNNDNEEVPVLYTRDYVLGHYEGHARKTGDDIKGEMKKHFLPSESQVYEASESEGITKLSWIRFDNLVWDCLDEVLAGKLRHVSGRYDDLGTGISNKGNSIHDKLFHTAIETDFSECTNLYGSESSSQFLDYTAPLVGKGVQEGMIMYHAMPFHRYWFHRCRQVLFNMFEFQKQYNLAYNIANANWEDMIAAERRELQDFYNAGLITACCKASITPHHSLVKDFLLCNGKEVNLTNFPNISLKNNNLLKDTKFTISDGGNGKIKTDGSEDDGSEDLVQGKYATPVYGVKKFNQKTNWDASSTYQALYNSSNSNGWIKLPNLFNFQEKYPRFIRGLNWSADTENIQNFDIEVSETNYVDSKLGENKKNMAYIKNDTINNKTNIWGDKGKCIVKNFTDVSKPYYFSFDYLTQKSNHRHLLFAKKKGLTSKGTDFTTLAEYSFGIDDTGIGEATITPVQNYPIINNNKDGAAQKASNGLWQSWYNYNFGTTSYFLNFQPTKTAGLYLFNTKFPYYEQKTEGKNTTFQEVNNIEGDNSEWHYYDAKGTKHSMDTANISNDVSSVLNTDFTAIDEYRGERNKRKQLLIKLNESEGAYPLSIYGGPSIFQTKQHQAWQRKRTSILRPRYEWEEGLLIKTNVATYHLHGINFNYGEPPNVAKVHDGTSHWRTMTSLQYWDCDKLGVGDISAIDKDDYLERDSIPPTASNYYNYNNVTDIWRKSSKVKSEKITYGSTVTKVDTSAPYPSFLNLIPLIRL